MRLRLREVRTAKGVTQQALGDVLGKSDVSILRYEKGRAPITLNDLDKIARYLGVDIMDLIELENKAQMLVED